MPTPCSTARVTAPILLIVIAAARALRGSRPRVSREFRLLRIWFAPIAPKAAEIVGAEILSPGLQIVEVSCWQADYNAGSILFAVPLGRPQSAELVAVESWKNGRIQTAYNVASPAFDAKTRTISATYKTRASGDCGTIQEMKWSGWHFRLLNVWRKDRCDGVPFEWDSRESWQVFPQQAAQPDPAGAPIRQQAGR